MTKKYFALHALLILVISFSAAGSWAGDPGETRKIDQALAQLEQRIGVQAREQAQARSVDLLTPRDVGQLERKRVPPPVETEAGEPSFKPTTRGRESCLLA